VGLDSNTEEGEMVKGMLKLESAPHIAICVFTTNSMWPNILGGWNGTDCTIEEIIDMVT